MPDLIIKPEATSGNKLILKDQAGGAVLTTSDSGVTAGDTILATKTGTETLTNKTLTAPTVANMSNCTFPAGHVIQTVFATNGTQAAVTGSSLVTAVAGSISLSNASNKILAQCSVLYNFTSIGGNDSTVGTLSSGFQFVSSGTGVSAETKKWGSYTSTGMYGFGFGNGEEEQKSLKGVFSGCWVFTPGTTNATTITISASGYSDDTMTVNPQGGDTPYHNHSQIVLQEIQA